MIDSTLDQIFPELEKQLRGSFQKVQPREKFVDRLQVRLTVPPEVEIDRTPDYRTGGLIFIVLALGLFGGGVLYWLLRRIFRN